MGVSREDVKRACIDAVENANIYDLRGTEQKMHKAIDITGEYLGVVLNPIHKAELPYMIAALESTLCHMKTIDKTATEIADSLIKAFDFKCGHVGSNVLAEAMRAMNRGLDDEDE